MVLLQETLLWLIPSRANRHKGLKPFAKMLLYCVRASIPVAAVTWKGVNKFGVCKNSFAISLGEKRIFFSFVSLSEMTVLLPTSLLTTCCRNGHKIRNIFSDMSVSTYRIFKIEGLVHDRL